MSLEEIADRCVGERQVLPSGGSWARPSPHPNHDGMHSSWSGGFNALPKLRSDNLSEGSRAITVQISYALLLATASTTE